MSPKCYYHHSDIPKKQRCGRKMSKFVSCTATSVQLGYKRFPDRHERPQVKAWRCDLTALSRSHNFYFLACNDAIYVYQPRFPNQSIPGEPALILHPPTTSPGLRPGIDPEDAHSITRLHVDYIGQDEIILITCDDGDVIGYRTVEIQRVMDEQQEASEDDAEGPIEEPVKTFLHRNVGASAWGLAIHREARMIAISANTHKVTVIAYALAQPDESSDCSSTSSDSDLDDCFDKEVPGDFPSPRRRDHTIVLPARHNVPSVSFNNSGDDPSGRWLSSCSINGETLIWDLHCPDRPARTIRVGYCASVKDPTKAPKNIPGTCACLRPSGYPHAIWSTMFLDANTAYENVSLKDLVPPLNQPLPYIRDVSKDKRSFSVTPRQIFSATHTHPEPAIEEASSEMEVTDTGSVASSDSEILSISSPDSPIMEELQQPEDMEMETNQPHQSLDEGHTSGVSTGSPSHVLEAVAPVASITSAVNAFGSWFQPADQNLTTIEWDDTDDESDTGDELVIPSTTHVQMTSDYLIENTRAYSEVITAFTLARQAQISSPLLIVTKEDVYLYQRPLDYAGDQSDYIVTMRRPLHPSDLHIPCLFIPGSHDRHCYTTQVPELGVFIIASPNGRAGVFSLTRAPGHGVGDVSGRPQFSFQLEYILPFANSDDRKVWDVEGARLIGVAAGPVQGMLDAESRVGEEGKGDAYDEQPSKRRWRIMMYYTDHTVLAFELGKKRDRGALDVEALIV